MGNKRVKCNEVIILISVIRADNRLNYMPIPYKSLRYCGNEETVKTRKIKMHDSI
jgi:hypothetical protein